MRSLFHSFLRNIELWLSGAGVAIVLVASALLAPADADSWQVAAITAVAVGVIHGVLFWGVRARQRHVRERAIAEIREMLADLIKNQLTVIGMHLPDNREGEELEGSVAEAKDSLRHIEHLVDTISEESLQDWKSRYGESIREDTVPLFN